MSSLKTEFIKYLSEKYLDRINQDINNKLVLINEQGILLRTLIADLTALDSDDIEFVFKIKTRCEVLTLLGSEKNYSFDVEYCCLLDNGIKNLTLVDINESGKKRFTYKESLTECFIPLNKKECYEKLAIRFLKHYLKNDYRNYPLDVSELVKQIGVTTIISTNFKDTLGKTMFNDCALSLSSDGELTLVKKGSIVINVKNLLLTFNDKLVRTTTVHECLHWHYHKKAFEIIMILNDKYKYFDCADYKPDASDPILSALAWMESQAYALAKACMMLEDNIAVVVKEDYDRTTVVVSDGMDKADYLYSIVSKVSDSFGTTMKDTIKRLVSLGYTDFENLSNDYYGSMYDSVIQNEKLDRTKTRRISQRIYDFMIQNSSNLKLAINSGLYVYADGFVVIKSPRYLLRIGQHYFLNTYARNHIEECTLVFNIKREYQSTVNPKKAYQLMIANSGSSYSTIYVGDTEQFIIADFMLESILERPEPEKTQILKNSYIHEDNLTFGEYFKILIERYKFSSVNDLIEATHCSRSVIENYRDLDDVGYSIEKVLSICAGMKLLPPESKHLIKKSGILDLNSQSRRAQVYRRLVVDCWDKGIDYWNKELKKEKIPLLYNEK